MTTIKMSTFDGVRAALKVVEREYRDVVDTPIAVSRIGNVREDDQYLEIDNWPHVIVAGEDGLYRIDVPAAVATAWLTAEERATIRERLTADADVNSDAVKALVREFQVWKQAIVRVVRTPDAVMEIVSPVPGQVWAGQDPTRIENVQVEDYKTYLVEQYRPPSRGGNTSAMHSHVIVVDGETYSWLARGSKKWIYASDRASFDFTTTDKDYPNVTPHSIVVRDAKGGTVRRGDRRRKSTWRSTTMRLPASRREARD